MTIRAQVSIPRDTALPEDVSVNTFHFLVTLGTDEQATDDVMTVLTQFYGAVDGLLSPISESPAQVTMYSVEDAEPRTPIFEGTIPMTYEGNAMPEEVAIALSYHAAFPSGVNRARRRGRIFLGPLARETSAIVGGRVRVVQSTVDVLADAAGDLLAATTTSPTIDWAIFSSTDNVARAIVGGWVDNAFDTIRSRGPAPTVRTLWPVAP